MEGRRAHESVRLYLLPKGSMSKTLIFGGTFNPVHVGHLRAAVEVAETLGFDRVEWTPSYAPLHKAGDALLRFDLRVELLRAGLHGHAGFGVSEIEKDLPVPSVTVQTLEAMARSEPAVERHFLLGDREFLRLHKWRRGHDVVKLAHIVIACRTEFDLEAFAGAVAQAWPGCRRVDPPQGALMAFELVPGHRAVLLPIPRIDISSSLVRQRWLEERSLAWLLPDGVIELLERHRPEVTAIWSEASAPGREMS
jgi:nicotinate-nucleotide adenylyltransferase